MTYIQSNAAREVDFRPKTAPPKDVTKFNFDDSENILRRGSIGLQLQNRLLIS